MPQYHPFELAPVDGTPILIKDANAKGAHSVSVHFVTYDAETAVLAGASGYWSYSDELLADAAPEGPETPFEWIPDPAHEP